MALTLTSPGRTFCDTSRESYRTLRVSKDGAGLRINPTTRPTRAYKQPFRKIDDATSSGILRPSSATGSMIATSADRPRLKLGPASKAMIAQTHPTARPINPHTMILRFIEHPLTTKIHPFSEPLAKVPLKPFTPFYVSPTILRPQLTRGRPYQKSSLTGYCLAMLAWRSELRIRATIEAGS
jgi:hypothetical protein